MKIIEINPESKIKKDDTPLVIGYFSCIHVMHYQLLTMFKNFNILTFKDSPKKADSQIYNFDERINILSSLNPEKIYVYDIDKYNITGQEFIEKVLKKINPSHIVVGSDFKFGSDGLTVPTLSYHFDVIKEPYIDGVSTTKIHDWLQNGQITKADQFLIWPYSVKGKWVKGLGKASSLGARTINLKLVSDVILPEGCYATKTIIGNKKYPSISFWGSSKTFKKGKLLETHILNRKISPRWLHSLSVRNNIMVEFYKFIRENEKFNSIDDMKKQIANDKAVVIKYFQENK